MAVTYEVDVTVEEIASGELDRLLDQVLDISDLEPGQAFSTLQTIRALNRALGEHAALAPRGTSAVIHYDVEATADHGSGETVTLTIGFYEPVDPDRTHNMSNGAPLVRRGIGTPRVEPPAGEGA